MLDGVSGTAPGNEFLEENRHGEEKRRLRKVCGAAVMECLHHPVSGLD